MKEVYVIIEPNGEITMQVTGVSGKTCLDITKELEADLKMSDIERKFTNEYYKLDNGQAVQQRQS